MRLLDQVTHGMDIDRDPHTLTNQAAHQLLVNSPQQCLLAQRQSHRGDVLRVDMKGQGIRLLLDAQWDALIGNDPDPRRCAIDRSCESPFRDTGFPCKAIGVNEQFFLQVFG